MVLNKIRARKDAVLNARDVSIFWDTKMSIPVEYAGRFVELLTFYRLVIAENLIKIYNGDYIGESFSMGLLMLR